MPPNIDNKDTKARFLAIVRLAMELNEALDWEELSAQLHVSKSTITKWIKEVNEEDFQTNILAMLDLSTPELETTATEMMEEAIEKEAVPQLHLGDDGTIQVVQEATVLSEEERSTRVMAFKQSVTGLQLLKEEVQGAAGIAVCKIAEKIEEGELTAQDLSKLTTTLATVYQAFFNKPTTNIQVNNVGEGSQNLLSSFRGNQQP